MPTSALSTEPAVDDSFAVLFSCSNDANAERLHTLLHSLGYAPKRVVREGSDAARAGLDVALARVFKRYNVRAVHEQQLARLLASGVVAHQTIARDLEVSKATLKWLTRTLCTRCEVANTTEFLALVLGQLDAIEALDARFS